MPESPEASTSDFRCVRCSVSLDSRRAFRLASGDGLAFKCLRCSFIDRALVMRSSRVALVVGTALIALNQGDQFLAGTFPWGSSWYKVPLTYLVPFCVATYGALSNGYRGAADRSSK